MQRLIPLLFITAIAVIVGSAQDLGSSNKLFGTTPHKSSAPKAEGKSKSITKRPVSATPKPSTKRSSTAAKKPTKSNTDKAATVAKRPAADGRSTAAKAKNGVTSTSTKAADNTSAERFKTFSGTDPRPSVVTSSGKTVPLTSAGADDLYEELIESGNAARDERNYVAAENSYSRARGVKPSEPRAAVGLGSIYTDQLLWEKAEAAYRDAIKVSPDDAITNLALSYVLVQPISAPDLAGRYEEAEELARRAIQLTPSNSLAYDQLGVALELRGIIGPETENAYRRAIQLNSGLALPYAHLGRLLRRRGLAEESADAYSTAIKKALDPPMMILVAEVLQSEQRYAETEKLLSNALSQDDKNLSGLLLLGRALMILGKYGEAEATLSKAVALSPQTFIASAQLGELYARQGKLEQAEYALMQASRGVTKYEKRRLAQQFEGLGDAYMKSGRVQIAERVYKQAVHLDPENTSLSGKLSTAQRRSI